MRTMIKELIVNCKSKVKNSQSGYTLIELLAVIIILVTVGGLITSILVTSLRGGNKSNTTNEVRENGNYIISQMSKMITFAKSFDGVSTDGTPNSYVANCIVTQPPPPTPAPAPVSYQYIKITSFDGGQTVFSCNGSAIASNGASLINVSNLSVSACSFLCTQTNLLSSPTIDINFTLSKAAAGLFVENQSKIIFQTSVTPRNN